MAINLYGVAEQKGVWRTVLYNSSLGLFCDIVTGLPWISNGDGSLEPRVYCIFLPGAHYLTINSPDGAGSSSFKLPLLLLLHNLELYVVACSVNRIDFLGIYVIMFVTVLSSLVKVRGAHIYKLLNLSLIMMISLIIIAIKFGNIHFFHVINLPHIRFCGNFLNTLDKDVWLSYPMLINTPL